MDCNDFIIYVDESRDHTLESINPEYRFSVLTFCRAEKTAYRT
jgi:hypothetical protein